MGIQTIALPSTTVGTANIKSDTYSARIGASLGLTVKSTGFNAADATAIIEGSNKNSTTDTDFFEVPESLITIAANSITYAGSSITFPYAYWRVKFVKNTNSAGTFEAIVNES